MQIIKVNEDFVSHRSKPPDVFEARWDEWARPGRKLRRIHGFRISSRGAEFADEVGVHLACAEEEGLEIVVKKWLKSPDVYLINSIGRRGHLPDGGR